MEEKIKRPIYKRWWFIVGIILILVIGVGGAMGGGDDLTPSGDVNNVAEEPLDSGQAASDPIVSDPVVSDPVVEEPTLTMGQKNALSTADDYLAYTAFSYSGLVEQLEYEGFSNAEAVFAVDNCGADWNEQAALMAQAYLDYTSFSRQGLIDQLEFEGFTSEQAAYGVAAVGY